MTIDRFTKDRFEAALPAVPRDEPVFIKGEWVYTIPVFSQKNGVRTPTNKRLVVRSGLNRAGLAAESGADSIRHWVEYYHKTAGKWIALGKTEKAYTTRVAGWEGRLTTALRELWKLALEDDRCGPATTKPAVMGTPTHDQPAVAPGSVPGANGSVDHVRAAVPASVLPVPQPDTAPAAVPQVPAAKDPFGFLGAETAPAVTDELPEPTDALPPTQQVSATREPNAQQRAAIEADIHTPLRVLAPPGSGKTFVMALRYAHLLAQGVDPAGVAAVTFNRTMADELLNRICKVNPDIQALRDSDPTAPAIQQITTIHALCYRILRAEGDKRSIPDKDGRVKPWQVKKALEEIIADLWPVIDQRPGYQEVQAVIATVKGKGLNSAHDIELLAQVRDKFGNGIGQQLHLARRRYDEWCQKNNVLDFVDMLYEVDRRLQDEPAFRLRWQQKFQYVMVDEGQDTSAQAMRILTTLAAPQDQITIVGDTDQLLYRFTGATPEANLYEGFEQRYPQGNMVLLAVNYRSTEEIITRCTRLIQHNYRLAEDTIAPYDGKYFKHTSPRPGAPAGKPMTFAMYDDPLSEAQAVAQHIKMLLDAGRDPGDFFVATRTCAQTGYLEGPLVQAGIPYINLVGTSFFTLKHIADVIAYVALAADEQDSAAFQRVYNIASAWNTYPWGKEQGQYCNHRFLGQEFLKACRDSKTGEPQYAWRWAATKQRRSWTTGVQDLEEFVREVQARLAYDSVVDTLTYIVDECYAKYLAAAEGLTGGDAADNGKLDDFETLKELAAQFGSDVQAFLTYVEQARTAAEQAQKGDWTGHVIVSTVHRLKGLERPVVFGMGLCEGVNRQGAEVGLLPHTYSMREPETQGIIPMGGKGRIEDERDICFVLVSRAQDECHLTGCSRYRGATMHPSRFIYELGLLEETASDDDAEDYYQDEDE